MHDPAHDFDGAGATKRSEESERLEPSERKPRRAKAVTSFEGIPGAWAMPAERSAAQEILPREGEGGAAKAALVGAVVLAIALGVGFALLHDEDFSSVKSAQPRSIKGALKNEPAAENVRNVDEGLSAEPSVAAEDLALPIKASSDNEEDFLTELPARRKCRFHNRKAEKAILQGRYRRAKKHLQNAVALDPTYAISYRNLGVVNARLGKRKSAKKAYEEYIRLAPTAEDAPDVRRILGL